MASSVVSDNFETGTGGVPQLGGADRQTQWCKAWVNFNGSGTVAIRDSYNVSSITDRGTGLYTVNFTNGFSNTNYSGTVSGHNGVSTGNNRWAATSPYLANKAFMNTNYGASAGDLEVICGTYFGD